jgi:hypothetical protein
LRSTPVLAIDPVDNKGWFVIRQVNDGATCICNAITYSPARGSRNGSAQDSAWSPDSAIRSISGGEARLAFAELAADSEFMLAIARPCGEPFLPFSYTTL